MNTPEAMAREGVHEAVEEILRNTPRGKILDVPGGHGALAVRLRSAGFDVSACDLYPEIFTADGFEIKRGDMDATLPYADVTFDCVVCIEGLEHIENPANAIREFARLLKSGGVLIVSVPNIMNIEERLKWLFSGYTSHFKPLSSETRAAIAKEYEGIEEVALHINPIGYSEVRFLLERYGFRLESVHRDRKKKNAWLFWPLVALIRAASAFSSSSQRQARWTDDLNSDEVLMGGNTLIFKATKI